MEKNLNIKMDSSINTEMVWVLLLMGIISILYQIIKALK